jgi:hypothetical protein
MLRTLALQQSQELMELVLLLEKWVKILEWESRLRYKAKRLLCEGIW